MKNLGKEGGYVLASATSSRIGGIVGSLKRDSTISNCWNTGAVQGGSQVGGIVGAGWAGQPEGGITPQFVSRIIGCYNSGNITALAPQGGGIAGGISTSEIISCYNTGSVSATDYYAGGLIGYLYTN